MRYPIQTALLICCLLFACSGRRAMQKYINRNKVPLGYISKSVSNNCADTNKTIAISVTNNPLDSISKVTVINTVFIPLIFYYYYQVNMSFELGQKSLEQPFDEFFRQKLVDESKRSGCYSVGASTNSMYALEISFRNSHTMSAYKREEHWIYMVIGYFNPISARATPSKTIMKATAVLRKNGETLIENEYEMNQDQDLLKMEGLRIPQAPGLIESNMAESLSHTSKACIESIVRDVNYYFQSNP